MSYVTAPVWTCVTLYMLLWLVRGLLLRGSDCCPGMTSYLPLIFAPQATWDMLARCLLQDVSFFKHKLCSERAWAKLYWQVQFFTSLQWSVAFALGYEASLSYLQASLDSSGRSHTQYHIGEHSHGTTSVKLSPRGTARPRQHRRCRWP